MTKTPRKYYRRTDEHNLAYRIAKRWCDDALSILGSGRSPMPLSTCLQQPYWLEDHIYEYEHIAAGWLDGKDGGGVTLSRAARKRVISDALNTARGLLTALPARYAPVIQHFTK